MYGYVQLSGIRIKVYGIWGKVEGSDRNKNHWMSTYFYSFKIIHVMKSKSSLTIRKLNVSQRNHTEWFIIYAFWWVILNWGLEAVISIIFQLWGIVDWLACLCIDQMIECSIKVIDYLFIFVPRYLSDHILVSIRWSINELARYCFNFIISQQDIVKYFCILIFNTKSWLTSSVITLEHIIILVSFSHLLGMLLSCWI